MRERRVTIEDIARSAGVSKVTVSYVLTGRGPSRRISTATVERVKQVAKDLDYRPSVLARMLGGRHSGTVAVVFQYASCFASSTGFVCELMRGVCDGCVEEGLDLMLHTRVQEDAESEANALLDGRADGILMLRDGDDPVLRILTRHHTPCVLFFSRSLDGTTPFVDCDNFEAGRLAVRHLVELGHRRIVLVSGPRGSTAAMDRLDGARSYLERLGVDPLIVQDTKGFQTQFAEELSESKRPTGLVAWSDDCAFECIRHAESLGLQVPQQLSVVGFDSTPACELSHPALTSVRQPIYEMSREATRLLARLIRRERIDEPSKVFLPTLDVRASTTTPSSEYL